MSSMEYIRKTYNVPAKRGARIRFQGRKVGRILSARGPHLRVQWDGLPRRTGLIHPTWAVEYLPNAPAEAGGTP
jgi:hypothetical protein